MRRVRLWKGSRGDGRKPGRQKGNTMPNNKKGKSASKGKNKTFASKRTMNDTSSGTHQPTQGSNTSFQERPLEPSNVGNFEERAEHARTSHRGQ